jgi:RNA polymerase sigma-70 factor (ECF subfamily)
MERDGAGEDVPEHTGDDLAGIYDAYAGLLYRYALSLVCSVEEAQDVLQEVFVGLLRRKHLGRIKHLREYLLRATRNQAYMHLRHSRRHPCEGGLETWVDVTDVAFTDREAAVDISVALSRLPVEPREVLTLRLMGQLSFREIGTVLGVPTPTAASRYRLALARLRALLTEGDEHA